jgi:sugar lactone lactonase YvrE/enterochelin esterase-like enzyme
VPQQYEAAKPACVMVFQDGGGYVAEKGRWRVPIVFDNLIHKKEMPVTIGIFINPGVVPAPHDNALARYNRSFEYDGLGDRYARFLLEEILPEVEKKYNLTSDPNGRAIGGASSGAIAAFTVAWERPDAFRRVFSTIGTYVGLRGGNNYPVLIRKTEPKPIRIFLQGGSNDLNLYGGSWWLANQDMLSALRYSGYDVKHVFGDGGHNSKHGSSLLPDALRWLWRDYPKPITKPSGDWQPRMKVLKPGEDWELVTEGYSFVEGPAVSPTGEIFFSDVVNSRIHKIGLDGKVSLFAENTGKTVGLMFGPDGKLYGCASQNKQIVAFDSLGTPTVIAEDVRSNDLTVSAKRDIYFTDPSNRKIWRIDPQGNKSVVDVTIKNPRKILIGIHRPNGILLSPDQSLLYVADTHGQFVYSFQIMPDGTPAHKQPYYHLHLRDGVMESGADGMTVDTKGRLYVATDMGIQVCDQAGRVHAILPVPGEHITNLVFGGPDMDTLYITCVMDKVYKRKTLARGVRSYQSAVLPKKPRL